MHKFGLCRHAVSVRLCVRPSVTFVHSVETNKYLPNFSPLDSHTILVFPYQASQQYSDGNSAKWGVECRWGRQNSRFPTSIWLHRRCDRHVLSTRCRRTVASVTVIAGSKRRSLLMAGDDDDDKTEQYLIVRRDKSVAYVTNNKRLLSTFCTIETNY